VNATAVRTQAAGRQQAAQAPAGAGRTPAGAGVAPAQVRRRYVGINEVPVAGASGAGAGDPAHQSPPGSAGGRGRRAAGGVLRRVQEGARGRQAPAPRAQVSGMRGGTL